MTGSTEPAISSLKVPQPGKPRRRLWALLLILSLLGGVAAWSFWPAAHLGIPPISFEGLDPESCQAMQAEMDRVKQAPQSGEAWGRLGQVLRAHGFDDEANDCFVRAEQLAPEDPRWPYLQGLRALFSENQAAIEHLRRACERTKPNDAFSVAMRLRLGEALFQNGQINDAEAVFRDVLKRHPREIRAHYNLGLLDLLQGRLEESRDHLVPCLESPQARRKATAQLSSVFAKMGNIEAAKEGNTQLSQMPPDLPWTDPVIAEYVQLEVGRQSRFLEAERLEGQGRAPESIAMLREIADKTPDAHSLVALGIALGKAGDYEDAAALLKQAEELEPDRVQAHYYLGLVSYLRAEQLRTRFRDAPGAEQGYREAVSQLEDTVRRKPDHGMAHLYLGRSYARLQQTPQAVRSFELAVQCRPEFLETHLSLADALGDLDRLSEARRVLNDARKLRPDDPRVREALARWKIELD